MVVILCGPSVVVLEGNEEQGGRCLWDIGRVDWELFGGASCDRVAVVII